MIEPIDNNNLNEILPLMKKYQEFYSVNNIDDESNRKFFSEFGVLSNKGCLFGYRKNK